MSIDKSFLGVGGESLVMAMVCVLAHVHVILNKFLSGCHKRLRNQAAAEGVWCQETEAQLLQV